MLFPVLIGLVYGEQDIYAFLGAFLIAATLGTLGAVLSRNSKKQLRTRDGFLVAILFWLFFSAFSALPLILDQRLNISFTDAVFESVSGITTTGGSVFKDIDALPRSILYYRAQLNFFGGLGIIVLAVAILPVLGVGGAKLYQSEAPGPLKEEKLRPRIADTAKHLWLIYSGLALVCGLAYLIAGMSWFDALCHSLSTVSLGGFSSHSDSLGYYNSYTIELIGALFTTSAAVSFPLYFAALYRRSLMPIVGNKEFQFFILVLGLLILATCFELWRTGFFDPLGSVVHGIFLAASVMTDNGLAAGGYPNWPSQVVLLLLGASFFGGCVGSTCGGIKAMRFLLMYRQTSREIKQLIHPNATYSTKVGLSPVSERVMRSVSSLFFVWIALTCLLVLGLLALDYDFITAFGTVAACINNMGIGYGATAATFGELTPAAKWLMCAAMLFGRLEIFPILVVFSRTFRYF
ncbi:potassium transporter TrkG [Proteobacteria bacterium 005FR1]|nr:potassium transporter TrkG [Proteobacteria bacterium 005FR1]